MQKWTQQELDALKGGIDGVIRAGTGDFSDCNFFGRSRVHIGPDSILGPGTQLGDSCALGEGCIVGDGFGSRNFLRVGEYCRFGADAHIGFGSKVGAGCAFAGGCTLEAETIIAEDVEIGGECTLYGVARVAGESLLHVSRVSKRKVYAFTARDERGQAVRYIGCTGVQPMPAKGFLALALDRADAVASLGAVYREDWMRLAETARYAEKMGEAI